ncbi:MAG TPA: hypothetical protein VLF14_02395 [Candidatus Binatia bacterium]|nr:hypothetical protein [Candidatus Binatia bacterium]
MRRPGLAAAALAALSKPWFAALALAVPFAVFAARAATEPVDDPDVWWIGAAGRDLLATLEVPRHNLYSFTSPAHPWVMHELAFGVLDALGLAALGPAFLPLASAICGAGVVVVAVTATVKRARYPASAVLALLLLLAGSRKALFAPRPSHFALLLPVAMVALAFSPGWSRRRATAAIVLEWLWANAHGSFALGVAILAAAAFDPAATIRSRPQRLGAAALAAAATLVNPYGIRLHGLVQRYLGGGDATADVIHRHIVEFFPIWRSTAPFVNPFTVAALAVIVLLVVSAFVRSRNLARAVISLALVGLAIYQARHTTLAVVVGAVLMHAEIDDLCEEARAPSRRPWPRLWAAAVVAPGAALAIALWWRSDRDRDWVQWIAPEIGDGGFARLAEELPSGANVYAPFQSSGLLLWLAAPRGVRVFFDSRNDCYQADVAEAAFALEREGAPGAASALLDRYRTRFVLVPTSHPVYLALAGDARWSIWRSAGRWVGFEKRPPQ